MDLENLSLNELKKLKRKVEKAISSSENTVFEKEIVKISKSQSDHQPYIRIRKNLLQGVGYKKVKLSNEEYEKTYRTDPCVYWDGEKHCGIRSERAFSPAWIKISDIKEDSTLEYIDLLIKELTELKDYLSKGGGEKSDKLNAHESY